MKASEMTNEELVSVLAEIPCKSWHDLDRETVHDTCREAAARLRNTTVRELAHRAAVESHKREVAELRECLADALEVVDSTVARLGIAEQVKSNEDYKRWRKALGGAKDEN